MLMLTRTERQEIVIGDPRNPIGVIRIADVRGKRVRLGLDFPAGLPVHRREIADAIAAQQKKAQ